MWLDLLLLCFDFTFAGTISSPLPSPSRASLMGPPISFQDPPLQQRQITWHLKDSDERAAAYIAGPAPCRWGSVVVFCVIEILLPHHVAPQGQ
jgi:hypothetical protein